VAPPGALFASLEDFQAAWNAAAQGTSVGQITSWTPIDVNGTQADMASIGGNLQVGAVLKGESDAVTQVALGWLPLADDTQQAAQNAAFNDAFAILVRTVNPGASAGAVGPRLAARHQQRTAAVPDGHVQQGEPRPGALCARSRRRAGRGRPGHHRRRRPRSAPLTGAVAAPAVQ
jgi:hypothetical protein